MAEESVLGILSLTFPDGAKNTTTMIKFSDGSSRLRRREGNVAAWRAEEEAHGLEEQPIGSLLLQQVN